MEGLEVNTISGTLPVALAVRLGGKLVPPVRSLKDLNVEFRWLRSKFLSAPVC